MTTDVRIRIDTDLLRSQRNTLIDMVEHSPLTIEQAEHLDGLINMSDSLLDTAEGFDYEVTTVFAPKPMSHENLHN